MKVYFRQVYIEPGVAFPFSHHFQRRLSEEVTALVTPSARFGKDYGTDFDLIVNVSAKKTLRDNEIRGPAVFRKTKDVEYSVFLPFDVVSNEQDVCKSALTFLLKGVCSVFEALGIDTARVAERQASLIESICSDPRMRK
jgi:hypothetical protein